MVFVMEVEVCYLLWHELIFLYAMSVRPSARLYISIQLALDGFSGDVVT
jgi:hypothetical protein